MPKIYRQPQKASESASAGPQPLEVNGQKLVWFVPEQVKLKK